MAPRMGNHWPCKGGAHVPVVDARPFVQHAALVTGAGRRLGRVLATRLAALGCDVVLHAHTGEREARDLASRLHVRGAQAHVVTADLADPGQVEGLVDRARKAAGRDLDFLVNNASTYTPSRVESLTWPTFQSDMAVNAWAPFALARAFHAQAKQGGAVVNILDTRIADYDWDHAGYILAKDVLARMTRTQAVALAPRVRVNAVAPGPVLPPEGAGEAALERYVKHLPLARTPRPDDVADAVLYLLGARSVTGQVVHVDGGRHLGRAVYDEAPASP